MFDQLTREYFAGPIGQAFRLALAEIKVELELVEVQSLGLPLAQGAWPHLLPRFSYQRCYNRNTIRGEAYGC
jgi:hypothetical protein